MPLIGKSRVFRPRYLRYRGVCHGVGSRHLCGTGRDIPIEEWPSVSIFWLRNNKYKQITGA